MAKRAIPVELSAHELALLTNAIGEAIEAIDGREFETRLGARLDEADELRRKLRTILATLEGSD